MIKVEKLSKQYRIGARQTSYGTLRDKISGVARAPLAALRGRKHADTTIWALKDVSFEIKTGEVVGIIGGNGAGKSTLLKVLSRITEPTTGRIELYGRVASLLEVGTGFHPELTGRENIYLNGAILGMKRTEIERKFDEIIAFAELDEFLDTPVKHYSSGMYMRLAFAVAAHLEPEILVIDEVLAVGDLAFQNKCLGKMGEVAKHGRTVVFVSHQMGAIAQLCNKALLLNQGAIVKEGDTQRVIDYYMNEVSSGTSAGFTAGSQPGKEIFITSAQALDSEGNKKSYFSHKEPIVIAISCKINRWLPTSLMGFFVRDSRGRKVFTTNNPDWCKLGQNNKEVRITATIPLAFLVPGKYVFTFAVTVPNVGVVDLVEDVLPITIIDAGSVFSAYDGGDYGCVFANCDWKS
ncbi:MAG: ABC transporter ATP-binding protein [Pyrinomonadaceae bacterium]|nr:ABC transporter ATP-binding protein [Pyrinomonadaceae bacterium]